MRRSALLLLLATLAGAAAPGAARAGPSPAELPGLSAVPWARLTGEKGRWVRYRVTGPQAPAPSYLTLSVVDADEATGQLWVEVRVSGQRGFTAAGVVTKVLVARGPSGAMSTERMIVRFGGGAPVELDLATVPPPAGEEDAASACVAPNSPACRRASGGPDVRTRPPEATMTVLGTVQATPVEVRTAEGALFTYLVSEAVPVTGLVLADLGMRGRMELEAVGEGAKSTVGEPVRKVSHDRLAEALAAGSPALGALKQVGRPVGGPASKGRGP